MKKAIEDIYNLTIDLRNNPHLLEQNTKKIIDICNKPIGKYDVDELWDTNSDYIDDNLHSLERFANSSVILKNDFFNIFNKINNE